MPAHHNNTIESVETATILFGTNTNVFYMWEIMPVFDFSNIIRKNIFYIPSFNLFLDSALNWQFGGCGSKVPISSGSNYPAGSRASAVHSSSCLVSNVNIKRERESERTSERAR